MPARMLAGTARTAARGFVAAMLISLVGLFSPVSAWAHGEGESDECYVLVRQALAYMANTPDDVMAAQEKVQDALKARNQNCVKPALVGRAMDAIDAGNMIQARDLLQHAVGAGHYTGANSTYVITGSQPLTGVDTGTLAALDPIPGRASLTARDWVILTISIGIGAAGVVLAFSLRPQAARSDATQKEEETKKASE